ALVFRLTDANNFLVMDTYLNGLHLYRRQAGTWVFVASEPLPVPLQPGTMHRLEVRTLGTTIEGWWDGVRLLQVFDEFQAAATRHGLDWNSAYDATTTYRNFQLSLNDTTVSAPPATPSAPSPASGTTAVAPTTRMTWTASRATSYDVRFGTTNPPQLVANALTTAVYSPIGMIGNTTYFLQVTAHNTSGTTSGPLWSFTTASPPSTVDVLVH